MHTTVKIQGKEQAVFQPFWVVTQITIVTSLESTYQPCKMALFWVTPMRGYWCFGFESFNKVFKVAAQHSNWKDTECAILESWSWKSTMRGTGRVELFELPAA